MKKTGKCGLILPAAALFAALILLSGCQDAEQFGGISGIGFRDIPGITTEEINAIEVLLKQNNSFVYGMTPST